MKVSIILNVFTLFGYVYSMQNSYENHLYDDNKEWISFKIAYGKVYENPTEELRSFRIFKANSEFVAHHNIRYSRGEESYSVKINQFADFLEIDPSAGEIYVDNNCTVSEMPTFPNATDVPDELDWVRKGAVTAVDDQLIAEECFSCWTFSSVAALETQYFVKTGKLAKFSKQQLLDCVKKDSRGCKSGSICSVYEYLMENGIELESDYPYEAKDGECRYDRTKGVNVGVTGFAHYYQLQEDEVKQIVANLGPVVTNMDERSRNYYFYHDGVFSNPKCEPQKRSHTAVIVGYGTTHDGVEYWTVKNSFGTNWGMNGYMRVPRNQNNSCGIALDIYVPILA